MSPAPLAFEWFSGLNYQRFLRSTLEINNHVSSRPVRRECSLGGAVCAHPDRGGDSGPDKEPDGHHLVGIVGAALCGVPDFVPLFQPVQAERLSCGVVIG